MKMRFADLMDIITDDALIGWFPQCETAAECREVASFAIDQIERIRDMRIGDIEAEARRVDAMVSVFDPRQNEVTG